VQWALKGKALRDDVTVIVIDAISSEDERTPAALQRKNGTLTVARCGSCTPARIWQA
jgi:hypothetical protein